MIASGRVRSFGWLRKPKMETLETLSYTEAVVFIKRRAFSLNRTWLGTVEDKSKVHNRVVITHESLLSNLKKTMLLSFIALNTFSRLHHNSLKNFTN